jgi:hypothetical protein
MRRRTWQRLRDRLEPVKGNQLSRWITLRSSIAVRRLPGSSSRPQCSVSVEHPSSALIPEKQCLMSGWTDTHELFGNLRETGQELIQFLRPRSAERKRDVRGRAYLLPFAQFATTRKVGTEESHHAIDDQQLVRAVIDESVSETHELPYIYQEPETGTYRCASSVNMSHCISLCR